MRSARLSRPLLCAISATVLAGACGSSSQPAAGPATVPPQPTTAAAPNPSAVHPGGKLAYGADQEPTGLNLNTSKDGGSATVNVMDRVWPVFFHISPDFKVLWDRDLLVDEPRVTSQNPQTVVFHINPKAIWSDGVPINVDDFVYFWQTQRDPAHTKDVDGKPIDVSTDGTGYRNITSITGSPDGKTVTVVFGTPFGDWRSLWSGIVPAHIAKRVGWNDGFDTFKPDLVVSGGPYMISGWNHGTDLTLVRNPKYWGKPASLDQILFRFLTDSAVQEPALANGEISMIYPQPQTDLVDQVSKLNHVTSELNFGLQFEHLDFNQRSPFLADPVVRKAIALALDRKALIAATVGQFSSKATALNNRMFVTNQPEYKDNSGGLYNHPDVAAAKATLEADGFVLGGDGVYVKNGKKLELRISTTSGNKLRESAEQVIQDQLLHAGFRITVVNWPSTELFGHRLPHGDFDLAIFAWVTTPFPSANDPLYSTTGGANWNGTHNPAVDAALSSGSNEVDRTKQIDDYNQADTLLWQDMTTLPLFQKPTYIAYRDSFANIHDNASAEGPFWNAETWGTKAAAP